MRVHERRRHPPVQIGVKEEWKVTSVPTVNTLITSNEWAVICLLSLCGYWPGVTMQDNKYSTSWDSLRLSLKILIYQGELWKHFFSPPLQEAKENVIWHGAPLQQVGLARETRKIWGWRQRLTGSRLWAVHNTRVPKGKRRHPDFVIHCRSRRSIPFFNCDFFDCSTQIVNLASFRWVFGYILCEPQPTLHNNHDASPLSQE